MQNSRITPHMPNVGRLMITDHGTHPPEFWAQVAAEQIAPINPDMTGKRRSAALALQSKIAEALEGHHGKIHADEHAALAADPDHHEVEAHTDNVKDQADLAIDDIKAAAAGTEWESHFNFLTTKPDWYDAYTASISELGPDEAIAALSPQQQDDRVRYERYALVHFEVARMFASHQLVERSHFRTSKKGAN